MLKNIHADAARDLLCALPVTHTTETAGLFESLGRILASDLRATLNTPPFDRSPYDGYAFRSADTVGATATAPVCLKITEELPAGKAPTVEVTPGYAAKILTGAPMPKGADATIKYEQTRFTEAEVCIFDVFSPDTDVVHAGDDIKEGALLAERGTLITAPLMGLFASQGLASVPVFKKPMIAVLNTGTELQEVGLPLGPAMIYNSNVFTLSGYLKDMGATVHNAGVVADNPEDITARLGALLETADMVITTGGASVGDYDWALTSATNLGAEVLFWKIDMKPGGAMMAAVKDGKVILSLSGNPGAAILGLLRIALPYIRKLCGRTDLLLPEVEVLLKTPLTKASPKLRLLRGRLELQNGQAFFDENEGQGNGAVSSLLDCDLLGEIPAGSPPLDAGTRIKAFRLS